MHFSIKLLIGIFISLLFVLIFYYIATYIPRQREYNQNVEKFFDTSAPTDSTSTTQCNCTALDISGYKTILSAAFGVGFKINIVPSHNSAILDGAKINIYYKSPTNPDMPHGMVSVSNSDQDGTPLISIKAEGVDPDTQIWVLKQAKSLTVNNTKGNFAPSTYYVTYTPTNTSDIYALQYDNGNLSIRLLGEFPIQEWILSTEDYYPGIKAVNYSDNTTNPLESVTSRAPLTYLKSSEISSIDDANKQKLSSILNLIKTNIQVLNTTPSAGTISPVSSSTFGVSENPIKINLVVGNSPLSSIEAFESGPTSAVEDSSTRIMNLLNAYDGSAAFKEITDTNSNTIIDKIQTQGDITTCTAINPKDYVNRKIGQCNCKL